MIITTPEIITTAMIWLGTEVHGWAKGHAAGQQQLIIDKKEYCPPVYKLTVPITDPWQQKQYETQCGGVLQYLQDKVPESELIGPVAPDTGGK